MTHDTISALHASRSLSEIVAELKQKKERMEKLEFTKASIKAVKRNYTPNEISKARSILDNLAAVAASRNG